MSYDDKYLESQIESLQLQESSILQQLQDVRDKRIYCQNLLNVWNNCENYPAQRDLTNKVIATFNVQFPPQNVDPIVE
jgi:hypothetical protein